MVQNYFTTTKESQINADYNIRLIGTAEKSKGLKEIVHIPSVKTKKQVSNIAGERSFLYGMYLSYLEIDSDFECQVSVDVLPTPESATATTIEVEFDGTATSEVSLDFGILDTNHSIDLTFATGATATQVAEAVIKEIQKWEDIPFDVTEYASDAKKVVLTSRVYGPAGAVTPVRAVLKGTGLTSTITITAGTNGASADEMIDYINKKEIKTRLYVFEDGIEVKNFIKALKGWQDFKDSDKRGRMIQTKVDTLENLIEIAEGLNESSQTIFGLKKVEADGYKCGHIFKQPCYFCSVMAGIFNLCYTEGTNFMKINSIIGTGDPSNISLPLAGTVLEGYTIIEGEEWLNNEDGNEIKLLLDSGVTPFTVNKIGNLVLGNMVTTYRKDKEGNLDENFHWLEFDEEVSSFLSYLFARQKRTMAHKRHEAKITKGNFIADCQTAYKVCSGRANDEELKRSFLFVEPEGIDAFVNTLRKNTVEDYANGKLTSTAIQVAVYAQLREIFMNFKFGYIS